MSATNAVDGIDESVAAEAAVWMVRAADRRATGRPDAGFERWLAEDPQHQAAFSDAAAIFDDLGKAISRSVGVRAVPGRANRLGTARNWWPAPAARPAWAAAMAVGLVAIIGVSQHYAAADPAYATAIGEQRTIRLEDATKIVLNTDTRLRVDYSGARRRILLDRGEALFEVASNPARPFYVEVDGEYVRAVGTLFTVHRDADGLEVTLLNGKVVVGDAGALPRVALNPGERLQLNAGAKPVIDRPIIDDVTAWRRGQLVFSSTPVDVAVAQMNRYSARPIVLQEAATRTARLSGVFETGDNEAFARNLAAIYGLKMVDTGDGYALRPVLPRRSAA